MASRRLPAYNVAVGKHSARNHAGWRWVGKDQGQNLHGLAAALHDNHLSVCADRLSQCKEGGNLIVIVIKPLWAYHFFSQEATPGARRHFPAGALEDWRPPEREATGGLVGDPEVASVPALPMLIVDHEAQRLALVGVQLNCQPGGLGRLRPLLSLQPLHQRLDRVCHNMR